MRLLLAQKGLECFDGEASRHHDPERFTTVVMSQNRLVQVCNLHVFTRLTALDLSSNRLETLHCALPAGLQILDLSCNNFALLPECVARLSQLHTLRLSRNRLAVLPVLPLSLKTLALDHNHFTTVPVLPTRIVTLDLSHNNVTRVTNLPASLRHFAVVAAPLSAAVDFEQQVVAWCPRLISLNGESVRRTSGGALVSARLQARPIARRSPSQSRADFAADAEASTLLLRIRTLEAALSKEEADGIALKKRCGLFRSQCRLLDARSVEIEHDVSVVTEKLAAAECALHEVTTNLAIADSRFQIERGLEPSVGVP
jgi:hypothetical protein